MRIRYYFRRFVLSFLGQFLSPSKSVHILNGHMVDWNHDDKEDGERFGSLLSKLHETCDFINFQDAVDLIISGKTVDRPTVAFTFDDGWRDCYTQIAPQLDKYGVNAGFFINPGLIDAGETNDVHYLDHFTREVTKSPGKQPLTWAQVAELQSRGYIIGAHTIDHYCINDDNVDELERQIGSCRTVIENRIGAECPYFAFPYGRLEHANEKSIEIASKYYRYVFSQSDFRHYFSYGGSVINRRHFEPFWPISHVRFFMCFKRK